MSERAMRRTRWSSGRPAWAALAVAALASACAARAVRITHDDLAALTSAASVSVGRHQTPAFLVETPGNTAVGSVSGVSGGGVAFPGRGAGNGPIEAEFGLDDPAIAVRGKVLDALAFETGARPRPSDVPLPEDDHVEAVRSKAGREGWLLDVKTLRWGLEPDPKLWTRYRVSLLARGRLIDLARGRVAWQAACDATEPDPPSGSTMPELTAHDAETLKSRLAAAADRCGQILVDQFFSGVR